MKLQESSAKRFSTIMAIVGWIALILQFYLALENRTISPPKAVLQFFSYFTVLTNIIAALSYTAVALNPSSGKLKSLLRPESLTAVTVYIVMVGIIYNTILRSLVELHGLNLIVDRTLHSVVPISFLLFWFLFVPKEQLQWKDAFGWLWYPVVYIIYVIILGELTGFYPYPFSNAAKLGYPKAILNGVWITLAFGALSLLFIAISKATRNRKQIPI